MQNGHCTHSEEIVYTFHLAQCLLPHPFFFWSRCSRIDKWYPGNAISNTTERLSTYTVQYISFCYWMKRCRRKISRSFYFHVCLYILLFYFFENVEREFCENGTRFVIITFWRISLTQKEIPCMPLVAYLLLQFHFANSFAQLEFHA